MMIVNSPWATSAAPAFSPCRAVKPPRRPATSPTPTFPITVTTSATSDDPADIAERAEVDRQCEGEEEQRREHVAHREEPLLDLLAHPALREDDAGHQRADRPRTAQLDREARSCR